MFTLSVFHTSPCVIEIRPSLTDGSGRTVTGDISTLFDIPNAVEATHAVNQAGKTPWCPQGQFQVQPVEESQDCSKKEGYLSLRNLRLLRPDKSPISLPRTKDKVFR